VVLPVQIAKALMRVSTRRRVVVVSEEARIQRFYLDVPVPGGTLQTHERTAQAGESQGKGESKKSDHENQLVLLFHGKGVMNTELDCAMTLPDCVSVLQSIEESQSAKRQRVFQ